VSATFLGGTEVTGGILTANVAGALPQGGAVTVTGGAILSLKANQWIGSLAIGNGTIDVVNPAQLRVDGTIDFTGPANLPAAQVFGTLVFPGTTAVRGSGSHPNSYDLSINSVTGTGGLTKQGSHVLRLTAVSSYAGPTAVEAGGLYLVAGGVMDSVGGPVTVGPTAVFGGKGAVNRPVTIQPDAQLELGLYHSDPGILTLSSGLTVEPGGKVVFNMTALTDDPTSPALSKLRLTEGDLNLGADSVLAINFIGPPPSIDHPFWSSLHEMLIIGLEGGAANPSGNAFSSVTTNFVTPGSWSTEALPAGIVLRFQPVPESHLVTMATAGVLCTAYCVRRRVRGANGGQDCQLDPNTRTM
jgi:autotransporter-associated beta strand protein